MEEEKKEKKEMNPKAVFITRLVATFMFAVVGPITYILARFKPFDYSEHLSIGFAGIVAIIIFGVAVCVLIKYYLAGMKAKFNMTKQILEGIYRILVPIAAALAICYVARTYINQLIEIFAVLIPFEAVAIVVNPLPKWAFENNVDGIGEITDKVFSRVKIHVKKED